jgi:benzoyl-CoA 2,3-dioxygenase component B
MDTEAGIARWNRVLEYAGIAFRMTLPHVAFSRGIGEFASCHADTDVILLIADQSATRSKVFLPSVQDNLFIASLLVPILAPGHFEGWIMPPSVGIDSLPGDFEYGRIDG